MKYIGLNKHSGKPISDAAHLAQSVSDILTTPIGSRVMRREYGSYLFALIDQPANPAGLMRLRAAAAHALMRWEKRLKLSSITTEISAVGEVMITITGKADNQDITITEGISP